MADAAQLVLAFASLLSVVFVFIRQGEQNRKLDVVDTKVAGQAETIVKLEKNTDGINKALLQVTAEKKFAEGVKEGADKGPDAQDPKPQA